MKGDRIVWGAPNLTCCKLSHIDGQSILQGRLNLPGGIVKLSSQHYSYISSHHPNDSPINTISMGHPSDDSLYVSWCLKIATSPIPELLEWNVPLKYFLNLLIFLCSTRFRMLRRKFFHLPYCWHRSTANMIISSPIMMAVAMMATMTTSSPDPRGCHLQMICAASRRGVGKQVLEPLRGLRELKRAFMLGKIPTQAIFYSYPYFSHISSIGPMLFPGAWLPAHRHGARTGACLLPLNLNQSSS